MSHLVVFIGHMYQVLVGYDNAFNPTQSLKEACSCDMQNCTTSALQACKRGPQRHCCRLCWFNSIAGSFILFSILVNWANHACSKDAFPLGLSVCSSPNSSLREVLSMQSADQHSQLPITAGSCEEGGAQCSSNLQVCRHCCRPASIPYSQLPFTVGSCEEGSARCSSDIQACRHCCGDEMVTGDNVHTVLLLQDPVT